MKKLLFGVLLLATSILQSSIPPAASTPLANPTLIAQEPQRTPQQIQQEVRQIAKNITVRITSENNGGSGVLIAQKGNTYLILTSAHVVRRATQIQVQAPDGRKYTARRVDGGFSPKYDLALLQIESKSKYQLPDLSDLSTISVNSRDIYSTGYPFDSNDLRINSGQISQLSDLPFDDGTQIGYKIDKGKQGIRQGMSGGPIFDAAGHLLGINTVGVAPILPDYTYNDGSKPIAKLVAKYRQANWGIPVYNFLTNVKPEILYGYANLPKVERQVTPTGYLAKLNNKTRQMTVRIENSGGNGSGVIVAKEGSTYYVLTAKHVMQDEEKNTHQRFTNNQIITYDQDRHSVASTVIAKNVDLAIVKFTTKSNYPLAQLSEHSPNNDDLVFVGGFPARENINSPLWQWQLNPGFILDRESGKSLTQNNLSFSNGYDLYYGNISYGGMSGGPVFDTDGQVIGIHGRAESTDKSILGGSLGISIQSFTGLLDTLQVRPGLLKITKNSPTTLNDRDRQTVLTALNSILQPEAGADGKRWLAYGNQLTRTLQFEKAIVAFDKAIGKGEVLNGNYGKMLSLLILGKYDAAKTALDRAIALVPNNKDRPKYYYFWKYQSRLLARLNKTDEALKAINEAIRLEPNDLNLEIEKATILVQTKQYAAALAIFGNDKMNRQPSAFIYFNQGIIKGQSGDVNGALADLDRAIKINPNYVDAYLARSAIKLASKDTNGALADLGRMIKINPDYNIAYWLRAQIYLQLKNYQAALADSNKAIELSNVKGFVKAFRPTNSISLQAYLFRSQANLGLKKFKDAIADLDRLIELSKIEKKQFLFSDVLPSVYFTRGVANVELEKFKDAIADLDRAIELSKAKGVSQSITSEIVPSAYLLRGVAKFRLDDKPGATSDLTQAANLSRQQGNMEVYQQAKDFLDNQLNKKLATIPSTDNAPKSNNDPKVDLADYNKKIALAPQNASLYIDRGILKVDKFNDVKGAIADCEKAISIDPKYAQAYFLRGHLKERLNDANGALADYNKAISLQERSANALNVNIKLDVVYVLRGNLKMDKLNDVNGALADYNKAIALAPKSVDAHLSRANLKHYKLSDVNGAMADYNKAIALDPELVDAYLNRGNLKKDKLNDLNGALADYDKTIALAPLSASAYFQRGMLKYQGLNDSKGAMTDINKSLELDSKFIDGYYNRGDFQYSLGNKTAAIADFQKVIALDKSSIVAAIAQGVIYLEQGALTQAIGSFDRAAKTSPDTSDIYKYRGLAYRRQGNKTAAIQDWRKAAKGYKQVNALKDYNMVRGWLRELGATE